MIIPAVLVFAAAVAAIWCIGFILFLARGDSHDDAD
jgi:hypothetical protein